MEGEMSGFLCCVWWFVFGALLGWLLAWWLGRHLTETVAYSPPQQASYVAPPAPAPAPAVDPKLAMIAAAAAAGFQIKGDDDLKIIEGIGPKIDALLKENGVHTFADLSRMDIPSISAILDKGGPRFKLANPQTWAQQAALAVSGDWHALKRLQDELTAGVRMEDDDQDGSSSDDGKSA
jgi:predicted flap endonuclease-1-like 5' DNA nuclease